MDPPYFLLLEPKGSCFQTSYPKLTRTESSLVSINLKRLSIFALLITPSCPAAMPAAPQLGSGCLQKEVFKSRHHRDPYKLGCAPKISELVLPCSQSYQVLLWSTFLGSQDKDKV